ncbi:hypothetical protein Tco_0284179, partial [Tanacetum coccineum]
YKGYTSKSAHCQIHKEEWKKTINYTLKPVTSLYLKWRDLPSGERHAYSERLSRDLMKMEYTHEDENEFVDYSWERAFSIKEDVYMEWCLEFFSTMYFEKKVDVEPES